MAYTRVNWENKPSTNTPINADNLNNMDAKIKDLDLNKVDVDNIKTINGQSIIGTGNIDILNQIYPIGSIVIRDNDTDYSSWLGFTWERTSIGKVLVGIDENDTDFDTIGNTGGEKTHTLTVDEMPSHGHAQGVLNQSGYGGTDGLTSGSGQGEDSHFSNWTQFTGGSQPHNIMQPYQVVAYWKRTS